jgi:hypothetical protein
MNQTYWDALIKYILKPLLLIGAVSYFINFGCHRADTPKEIVSRGLKPNETAKTVVVGSKVTTHKRRLDGRVERIQVFVPPEAPVTVVVDTKGDASVKVSRAGLCFAPGVGVSVGPRLRLVLDCKFLYVGRYSFLVGVPVTGGWDDWQGPYGALGYHIYKNTSIYGGYAPLSSKAVVGVRVSF